MSTRRDFLAGAASAAVAARGATALAQSVPRPAAAPLHGAAISLGDEVFLAQTWRELRGRGVGIVTNQTGVTADLVSIVDAVRENPQIRLRALYAPEHGLRGDRTAGSYVASYTDAASGLPVYSLYGATRRPTAAMLAGVDVIVVDLQDVGDRAYTYASTVASVMEAARAYDKDVWVLDRPNPIGGEIVEGPVLEETFKSFIGLFPIPIRHGLTMGELARLFNDHFGIGCRLRVVPMTGYSRAMLWPNTGLTWTRTSPNIPTWETTLLYPATGLVGAFGINNGVGLGMPFAFAGGPHVSADRLAARLAEREIPGLAFRPRTIVPESGFFAGKPLGGVAISVLAPHEVRAVRTAVELICAVRDTGPGALAVVNRLGLDKDWGTDAVRRAVFAGESPDAIVRAWEPGVAEFRAIRRSHLLYA